MKASVHICLILLINISCSYSQGYKLIPDIPYTTKPGNVSQTLDIYIPDNFSGILPCVIWIHGGAWMFGSKEGLPSEIDILLKKGFVISSINYRLSNEAIFPAQIHDCKAAVRFIKANGNKYSIDSSRIVVSGASAGGHLAALLGTSSGIAELEDLAMGWENVSSKVNAVIDFYGPTDFLLMDNLPDTPPDSCTDKVLHLKPDSPESLLLGCDIRHCTEKVKMADPMNYITEDDPPFLIFHGTYDCVVTPLSSKKLLQNLKEGQVKAELRLIPHAGHGGLEFTSDETKKEIIEFLNEALK